MFAVDKATVIGIRERDNGAPELRLETGEGEDSYVFTALPATLERAEMFRILTLGCVVENLSGVPYPQYNRDSRRYELCLRAS